MSSKLSIFYYPTIFQLLSLCSTSSYCDTCVAFVWFIYKFTFILFSSWLPTTEKEKPCQELATIGGALHSLLDFLFAVSSIQEKEDSSVSSSLSSSVFSNCSISLSVSFWPWKWYKCYTKHVRKRSFKNAWNCIYKL